MTLLRKSSSLGQHKHDQKPNQSAQHMDAVETDQRVEKSAVDAAGHRQAKMKQSKPFKALDGKKNSPQQCSQSEKTDKSFAIVAFNGFNSRAHRESAGQQDHSVHARDVGGKPRLERGRPGWAGNSENDIGADQSGKEHSLGPQEHENADPGVGTDRNGGPNGRS